MLRFILATTLASLPVPSFSQHACRVDLMVTLPDILAPCCENQEGGCSDGFPLNCPQTCAEDLVSFWDMCSEMLLSIFPDDHFPGFSIADVGGFVGGCRQERVMLERGEQAQCGARVGGLEQRVDQVVDACCIQAGKNECAAGGTPDGCKFIAETRLHFHKFHRQSN